MMSDEHGKPHMKSSSLGSYSGGMLGGLRHGQGTLVHEGGCGPHRRYSGEWQHGVKHGHGREESGGEDNRKVYEGGYYQGLREGKGVLEMKDGSCYYGLWKCGKRDGPGLLVEIDKDTQRPRCSKVLYADDELKQKVEDQFTPPQELIEAHAPAFYLFHQRNISHEEYTDKLFLPGISIVLDFANSKSVVQSSQVEKYQKALKWQRLSDFLYDKTLQALDIGELCLMSLATQKGESRLLDQLGDFNPDLFSLLGCLMAKLEMLQAVFRDPDLDLSLNAMVLNLYSNRLKGGELNEVIVDFVLPFLAPNGDELAFIQTVCPTTAHHHQFEVWPALLMKGLAKIHGTYFKLRTLNFDTLAYDLLGQDPSRVEATEEKDFLELVMRAGHEKGGLVVAKRISSNIEPGSLKDFVEGEQESLKASVLWSHFNSGQYYPILATKYSQTTQQVDSEKTWFYRVVSHLADKSEVKNGLQTLPEVWLSYRDLKHLFADFRALPHPGSCYHTVEFKTMNLTPTSTYNLTFFTFKVVRDDTDLSLTFTQDVEWSLSDGTFSSGTLPMQCFLAKQRYRKGDQSVAYQYIEGFGQSREQINNKRLRLSAGTYLVMLELEYVPKKGSGKVEAHISVQLQSDHNNYVRVKKLEFKQAPEYQTFYTECLSTLALNQSKKQFFKTHEKIVQGRTSKVQTDIWTVQYFSPVHATYVQIFCNETGLDEESPPLSWTQQITFVHLRNMMEMKFNTMQLQLPKQNEAMTNVKYNVDVPPGGNFRYLIIRQVRGEAYELKGGKSEVSIAEVDDIGLSSQI